MNPDISVLMPVYNAERFVGDAIESILRQDFSNFELIIIDDGSQDDSELIIDSYAVNDSRIKFIRQKNAGISKTRNRLIDAATAEFVAWMDADDISTRDRLSKQLIYLNDNPECVAVGCKSTFIDEHNQIICDWHSPEAASDIDDWHINGRGGAIIFPSSMMRKSKLIQLGCFDPSLTGAEDLCLFLRLAEIGDLINIPEKCFLYRQHLKSISHRAKIQILKDRQLVIDAARKRRELDPITANKGTGAIKIGDIYEKWAWWALRDGYLASSRKYAWKAFVRRPWSVDRLKLIYCSRRGY